MLSTSKDGDFTASLGSLFQCCLVRAQSGSHSPHHNDIWLYFLNSFFDAKCVLACGMQLVSVGEVIASCKDNSFARKIDQKSPTQDGVRRKALQYFVLSLVPFFCKALLNQYLKME